LSEKLREKNFTEKNKIEIKGVKGDKWLEILFEARLLSVYLLKAILEVVNPLS